MEVVCKVIEVWEDVSGSMNNHKEKYFTHHDCNLQ